jgi:hypothetical protein
MRAMIHPLSGGEEEFERNFDPGNRHAFWEQSGNEIEKRSRHDRGEVEEMQTRKSTVEHF